MSEFDLSEWNRLREIADKLEAEFREIRDKLNGARTAEFEERVRLAALGYGAPVPLGSKVCQWIRVKEHTWKKAKDVGTVECVTHENRANFSAAQSVRFGTFVVRINGGKKFVPCCFDWGQLGKKLKLPVGWFPEGVTPEPVKALRLEDIDG